MNRAVYDANGRLRLAGGFISVARAQALGVMPEGPPPPIVEQLAAAATVAPPRPPPPAGGQVVSFPSGQPINVGSVLGLVGGSPAPATPLGTGGGPPPAPASAPGEPPAVRGEVRMFSGVAAGFVTNIGISGMAMVIRKRGRIPNEPDEDDKQRVREATAEGIAAQIGDGPIPWWATVLTGYASLGTQMWIGAKPLNEAPPAAGERDGQQLRDPPPLPTPAETPARLPTGPAMPIRSRPVKTWGA